MSGTSLLSFGRSVPPVQGLTETDFLRQINWKRSTPAKILNAVAQGDKERFQQVMMKYFAHLLRHARSGSSSTQPQITQWNFYPFEPAERFSQLKQSIVEALDPPGHSRKKSKASVNTNGRHGENHLGNGRDKKVVQSPLTAILAEWLHEIRGSHGLTPPEWLLLSDVLVEHGDKLAADIFCRLWRALLTDVLHWSHTPVEQFVYAMNVPQQTVIIGEIPLRAGLLFAHVKGARAYRAFGKQSLEEILEKQIDDQGLPPAQWLPRLAESIASFFRVEIISRQIGKDCWSDASKTRCGKLLLRGVLLCDEQGNHPFLAANAPTMSELLEWMSLALPPAEYPATWKQAFALAKQVGLPLKASRRKHRARTDVEAESIRLLVNGDDANDSEPTLTLSANSEEGRWGTLRSISKPKSAALAVVYQQPWPALSFHSSRLNWFQGAWEWDLTIDGQAFSIPDDWDTICWTSDDDGDYLELQKAISNDIHFERQIMLTRREHWLLLADSFSGLSGYGSNPIPRLEYSMRLHLGEGVRVAPARSTREITLLGEKKTPSITAYPLALPQERDTHANGELTVENRRLLLRQSGIGDGLYAPLIFDLYPESAKSLRRVWRTLTISENMSRVKPDVASGHRLQLGDRQWLIYHSLKNSGAPRAVLGHHTLHETVIGRFDPDGKVKPLLLIEPVAPDADSE